MTTRETTWPQGTPCWVDLVVPDVDAAQRFYGELFGWHLHDMGEGAGGYRMASLSGRPVAGMGPVQPGQDIPPVWTTYIAVDDVDAITSRVTDAGGQVVMPAMDVMQEGRMAVVADSTGAVFGLWQALRHRGAELVNEPGTLTWNECMTRDYDGARKFYADVFGYDVQEMEDPSFRYSLLHLGTDVVGGVGELGSDMPAEIPPHWMCYFKVADTDETLQRAAELGAQVRMPPQDTPYGRMAVLQGAQGEIFAVIG